MHFKYCDKNSHPLHDPLKYPTVEEGGGVELGEGGMVLRRQNKIIVVSLECNLNPILTTGTVPDISKTIINTFRSNL